jgi:CheY-like chemotaxis protein
MRVMIAHEDVAETTPARVALQGAGHHVEVVTTGEAALAALRRETFDALVIGWMMPDVDGPTICRRLRARVGHQPVVILASPFCGAPARAHAVRVGADELLQQPLSPRALVDTLRKFEGKVRAPRQVPTTASTHGLERTKTWRDLPTLLGSTLIDCTTMDLVWRPVPRPSDEVRATLAMVDVEHMVEVNVGLFATRRTAAALARVMIGDVSTDPATLHDLLGELCNNVLGATKRALLAEHFTFALALESSQRPPTYEGFTATLAPKVIHTFLEGDVELCVVVGFRTPEEVTVASEDLREHMIVGEDIRNEHGALLVAAGTRLSATTAARMGQILRRRRVRVCMPYTPSAA